MNLRLASLVVASLCLVACDGGDKSGAEAGPAASDKADAKPATAKAAPDAKAVPDAKAAPDKPAWPDPCSQLSEAKFLEVAKVPSDAVVTIEQAKFGKTVCDFRWLNAGAPGIFSGKVTIGVTPKPLADADAATKAFKKAIDGLSRDMSAGGKPPEFTDISGIGDESSWWGSFGQLSTRKGDRIIYVTVAGNKTQHAERLELAKAITLAIFAS